jgi:hypothetical protein
VSRRYPDAKVYGSDPAAARISKKYPSLRSFEPLSKLAAACPSDVALLEPPGMRIPDVMVRASTSSGWLWAFNDTVMNIPQLPSTLFGKMMKWTDSGPGFKVARFFTMIALKDKKRFKQWWLSELQTAPPTSVFTGHGQPVLDRSHAGTLQAMVDRAL